jgi:Ca2+-binding RTX toxin-like protein
MTVHLIQPLEPRQMMSAVPTAAAITGLGAAPARVAAHQPMKKAKKPAPTEVAASLSPGGTVYVVGTAGNDGIHVVHSGRYVTVARTRKGGKLLPLYSFRANRVASVFIEANAGNDVVNCHKASRPCSVQGGDGNDFIHGSNRDDELWGEAGDDEIQGHDGGDWIVGHEGDDTLVGLAGDDHLIGGTGRDNMMGGAGDDDLDAADGQWLDLISGGGGDDSAWADKNRSYDVQGEWQDGYWEKSHVYAADIEHISG